MQRRYAPESTWGELSVTLTDHAGITEVNRRFLGRQGITDVISFHYAAVPGESSALEGDILVNAQQAQEASRRWHSSPDYELAVYITHGLLHLIGEDDRTPHGRRRMRRLEQAILHGVLGRRKIRNCSLGLFRVNRKRRAAK